ncbi:hypothetical protein IB267_16335 [Ensifer sp. ENS09]|uniref:hypothetical protein n=1 Tax=Ensifer sp. ENS09 TaxID=2769263 RepID=UPI00177D1433|nr:hypothetical protein [Ensifer sp. ENS09]MBD9649926.1 hypothetical protein [Ensifer sp. ENS09]
MKPQQRKFIVEVKPSRRRSAVRPASIWGDTDLKALAREAESQAPHLFETVGQADAAPAPLSAEGSDHDGGSAGGGLAIAGLTGSEEVAVLPAHSEAASRSQVNVVPPAEVSQLAKRPRAARIVRRARSKMVATAVPVAADALAALEEENRRLKELLARRLRQENALLLQMLERFSAN